MIRDFLYGLSAYGKALTLSSQHRLWSYWLFPALLGMLIAATLLFVTWQGGAVIGGQLVDWYPFERGAEFVSGAAPWIARIISLILGVTIFKYVLLIIVSPFMSLLSERLESILDGGEVTSKFSFGRAISEMWRGIRLAVRNLWRELIFVIFLTLLSFVGPLAVLTAPLIFLIQSYYAGFGNMDFTMERRYSLRSAVHLMRSHRGSAMANGLVFLLLIASLIGILVAPTWSTIAGMLEVRRLEDQY
ncbi:MAG: EI24 domain-containing protein [Saprospiraceae bacterium]|nr:EI24 domain-containing protein [Saprospiraceae bacterium]